MASTPISTIFDAAKWFLEQAEGENEYIPPLKLNCLLYLAQSYYAGAKVGVKMMPAYFVAHDLGPLDPNLYRALEQKSLNIFYEKITGDALLMLKGVWKKYGRMQTNELAIMLKGHTPYKKAFMAKIKNNEILLSDMASFYGLQKKEEETLKEKPKILRSQNGAMVNVKQWQPKKKGV